MNLDKLNIILFLFANLISFKDKMDDYYALTVLWYSSELVKFRTSQCFYFIIQCFAVDEISSDGQKCKKGVLALGKFLQQKQSPRVESNQVELKNIHENNPFKKRKLPADNGQELGQNELLIDLQDEKSELSCSALSQESNHTIKDTTIGFWPRRL